MNSSLMNGTLNIIIRGYLYKNNYEPRSSARNKFPNYTHDFRKLIKNYKILFETLSTKYKVNIVFVTYDTCPDFIKKILVENNWNFHLIPEENSTQFSSLCSFLETTKDNNINLVIRSDLILKKKLIELLYYFDFQNIKNLTVLGKELNKNLLNDILFIFPQNIDIRLKLIKYLKGRREGHGLDAYMRVSCLLKKKWNVCDNNEYYQIYRGDFTPETDISG